MINLKKKTTATKPRTLSCLYSSWYRAYSGSYRIDSNLFFCCSLQHGHFYPVGSPKCLVLACIFAREISPGNLNFLFVISSNASTTNLLAFSSSFEIGPCFSVKETEVGAISDLLGWWFSPWAGKRGLDNGFKGGFEGGA